MSPETSVGPFGGQVATESSVVPPHDFESTSALNDEVHSLCRNGELDSALNLIHEVEDAMKDGSSAYGHVKPDQSTYAAVMNTFARSTENHAAEETERILRHMEYMSKEYPRLTPKGQAYNAVILAWSNSKRPDAAEKADSLLNHLWSLYHQTQDKAYIPTRATYTTTITAWARCAPSKQAAERAEELLEEMESYRARYPLLGPTTACVNAVL